MSSRTKYHCIPCDQEYFSSKRAHHEKTNKHLHNVEGTKDEWTCEDCNITMKGRGKTSHLNGKSHREQINKNNKDINKPE